jgi:hypothetical protein
LETDDRLRPRQLAVQATVLDFELFHARVNRLASRIRNVVVHRRKLGQQLASLATIFVIHRIAVDVVGASRKISNSELSANVHLSAYLKALLKARTSLFCPTADCPK